MSILRGTLFELLFNHMLLEKGLSVTMSSDKIVYVCECDRCHKPMGGLTQEELNHVASSMSDGLCFDCDPESAATTPSIFWQWREGEKFVIGSEEFEVWALPGRAAEMVHVRTHERTHERDLSSYTNLNRISKNQAVLGKLYVNEVCPECHGLGYPYAFNDHLECLYCAGAGSIRVLQKWVRQLLGMVVENA